MHIYHSIAIQATTSTPVFPLAAADQLSNLGHQHIHGSNCLAVVVQAHVEGLDLFRVVVDDHRLLVHHLRQVALMLGGQVNAPVDILAGCAERGAPQKMALICVVLCLLSTADGDGYLPHAAGFRLAQLPSYLQATHTAHSPCHQTCALLQSLSAAARCPLCSCSEQTVSLLPATTNTRTYV